MPDMKLIRQHFILEGLIQKECLIRILDEVTQIYSKLLPLLQRDCPTCDSPIVSSLRQIVGLLSLEIFA